jgi:Protein of unknown function (DUF1059)
MPDDKALHCDCGFEVTGADEMELVDEIRRHALGAHGIAFSFEEALLVVLRTQLDLPRLPLIADACGSPAASNEGGAQ